MLRDDLTEFSYLLPPTSAHVWAVMISSSLFYLGLEGTLLANQSFLKTNLINTCLVIGIASVVLGSMLMSYAYFAAENLN